MRNWDQPRKPAEWEQPSDPDRFRRLREQSFMTPPDGILLGDNLATQLPIYITSEQLRTHMHVVGATNVGKSFFLEGMMKELIMGGRGLCLIDPHGDLYHRMLDFCAYMSI